MKTALVSTIAVMLLMFFCPSCQRMPAPGEAGGPATRPKSGNLAASTAIARPSHPLERHLRNIVQLTDGGENAEAYFSSDGSQLVFQSKRPPHDCDQIYTMNSDGSGLRQISNGLGRTTCAYFLYPDDSTLLYSSTHLESADCPPPPDRSQGYVWAIYDSYDVFTASAAGGEPTTIVSSPGYDAEATLSPDGSRIVFTSTRDGDLDIYSMNSDGSDVVRLTATPGYDGGPFYSPDGKKIVYRARHPEGEELADYQRLLEAGLVRPSKMDIFVMDADGKNQRQITDNGAANFCPFFLSDGERIIFASNMGDAKGREFDLFIVGIDGKNFEQVTFASEFDGFPMFSPDGKKMVWCSNRHHREDGETNVFICDWVN
ncbi:MAG TPA: hypothetical protein EYN79_04735 [Planctomycetes bacterium]|nr:hypothetical protein [Planctomycetota bacterium]HIN81196.1 hypothetical protein [Planctomycetota bacterium]